MRVPSLVLDIVGGGGVHLFPSSTAAPILATPNTSTSRRQCAQGRFLNNCSSALAK